MKWIDVNERLPMFGNDPSYDWVPVTDGQHWTIARYGHTRIHGKIIPAWEFFDSNEDNTNAPFSGDANRLMQISDIKYWIDIWPEIHEIRDSKKRV